jgi:hypothetical protein
MQPGDHFVGHSAGVLIWQASIVSGATWGRCMLFSGAATSDGIEYPADALEQAIVIHNPHDQALRVGSWIPKHPFGKLGRIGYAGKMDRRFVNIAEPQRNFLDLDHSHYGKSPYFEKWVNGAVHFFAPHRREEVA